MIRLSLALPVTIWADLADTLYRRARHPLTRPDRKVAYAALREQILTEALGLPPFTERLCGRAAHRRAREAA